MGDNLCCCGIEDLKGFKPNNFNINHMMNGDLQKSTESMNKIGTASAFKGIYQKAGAPKLMKKVSFKDMMLSELTNKKDFYKQMFGKKQKVGDDDDKEEKQKEEFKTVYQRPKP